MLQGILNVLIRIAGSSCVVALLYYGVRFYTIRSICTHPELSDEKVKAITRMIAKDKTQIKN